uniref:uncharacterized protein LOC124010798 isoform X2 n=1 Tax=Oncorhynchus gorbuscha TaxID=8017 RepID=UPI001EAEE3C1|nr:uncharacterized protein LOC124010798 isoform X2 [Oncorhynchus gorbuscha]
MSKLQLLNVFVTERLSAAAVEIFVVVEKIIAEFQEEICRSAEANERLRRLLDMTSSYYLLPFPLSSRTVSRSGAPV